MINELMKKCNEKIEEIKKFYDDNIESFMQPMNFKVYDVAFYNNSEKLFNDYPILKDVEYIEDRLNNLFSDFCDLEYEYFKEDNDINLCQYIGSTSTFHIIPQEYQSDYFYLYKSKDNFVDEITAKILDYYNFINVDENYNIIIEKEEENAIQELKDFINDVDYQLSLFDECIDFYNNLKDFKDNQVDNFKCYVYGLAEDVEMEKKREQQEKKEKLQALDCVYNALNLYIDITTPHELKNYSVEIEKYKTTLEKVKKEMEMLKNE